MPREVLGRAFTDRPGVWRWEAVGVLLEVTESSAMVDGRGYWWDLYVLKGARWVHEMGRAPHFIVAVQCAMGAEEKMR